MAKKKETNAVDSYNKHNMTAMQLLQKKGRTNRDENVRPDTTLQLTKETVTKCGEGYDTKQDFQV